jgi:plasmid stability protein
MDLNLRGVDEGLVTRLKVRAARENSTLKDVAVGLLEKGVGDEEVAVEATGQDQAGGTRKAARATIRKDAGIGKAVRLHVDSSVSGEIKNCKRCNSVVLPDPKNPRYWKCVPCGRQLDQAEVC